MSNLKCQKRSDLIWRNFVTYFKQSLAIFTEMYFQHLYFLLHKNFGLQCISKSKQSIQLFKSVFGT